MHALDCVLLGNGNPTAAIRAAPRPNGEENPGGFREDDSLATAAGRDGGNHRTEPKPAPLSDLKPNFTQIKMDWALLNDWFSQVSMS